MTKLRTPGSVPAAILETLGIVGKDAAETVTGHSFRYLHQLSDEDERRRAPIDVCIGLDQASKMLGRGTPIFDCYRRLLDGVHEAGEPVGPDTMLRVITGELGDVARTFEQAAADGKVSPVERSRVILELQQLVTEAQRMITGLSPPPQGARRPSPPSRAARSQKPKARR